MDASKFIPSVERLGLRGVDGKEEKRKDNRVCVICSFVYRFWDMYLAFYHSASLTAFGAFCGDSDRREWY